MRKSNFALRLQPGLLEELRTIAASEGVALNLLISIAVAEKLSALRAEEYFASAPGTPIVPEPCEFSKKREPIIPWSPVTIFLLQQGQVAPSSEVVQKLGNWRSPRAAANKNKKGGFSSALSTLLCDLCALPQWPLC